MVNGILTRIRSIYDTLRPSEKSVAKCVLADPDRILTLSIHRLAQESGVSVASVTRFYRALGLGDFKRFKISLAKDTVVPISAIYGAVTLRDLDEDIVKKVFAGTIKSLEDTLKILDISAVVKASRLFLKAKRIVFFGIGGSAFVAQDAALRFSHLGIPAEAYTDSYQILVQAFRMRKNEVAVGISHSGRSSIVVNGLKIAAQRGAITMGISNYLGSPLAKESRFFFCTSFQENQVRAGALSSRTAQICLIDLLYVLVARRMKDIHGVEELSEAVEKSLRLSHRG